MTHMLPLSNLHQTQADSETPIWSVAQKVRTLILKKNKDRTGVCVRASVRRGFTWKKYTPLSTAEPKSTKHQQSVRLRL